MANVLVRIKNIKRLYTSNLIVIYMLMLVLSSSDGNTITNVFIQNYSVYLLSFLVVCGVSNLP